MEYSHEIITRNEFKTSYKLAAVFQLNNADFPVLLSKYVRKAVSGCTKVPSSKFISNIVAKSLRNFFFFVNLLVYLCLLKASVALLIVLKKKMRF